MKIAFHTLGCKVNQYETEVMKADFHAKGHEIVGEQSPADVYVINTCTVTAMADRKSRQFARRMKRQNPDSVIVVTGCYSQVSPDDVAKMKEVDIITGTAGKTRIPEYVEEFLENRTRQIHIKGYEELDCYEEMGAAPGEGERTRAYIKIQEGCNRFCSYCVIPYARGKIRSRSIENIVEEAKGLIAQGYKEIVLTGINTALYDMEDGKREGIYGVEKAIAAINELEGDFRIRLSSLEPAVVNAEYVKGLLKYDKLCHHVHLSAQSGSDAVLAAMNRPYSKGEYLDIVRVLRQFDPLYGISTDIIVGFPGEKEADFQESMNLTDLCEFVHTHIFQYSKRPFTKAAQMPGHVAPQIKKDRADRLSKLALKSEQDFLRKNKGKKARILIEEYDETLGMMTGYSGNYIYVYVNCGSAADFEKYRNEFLDVTLTDPFQEGMMGVMD